MNIIHFLVQGSSEAPYHVTFQKEDKNLSAYCSCPAGENGQYCKHRFNILGGITEGIVSNNLDQVHIVKSWLVGTDVEKALLAVMDAEEKFELAKLELSTSKKRLAKSFRD